MHRCSLRHRGLIHLAGQRGRGRRRRRLLLRWSPVALIALAAAILLPLAVTYQPLQPGGASGISFPGLRTGNGIRWVSQYIPNGPYLYVPVQRRPFALTGSVVNRGSFPVTIVGVWQQPGSPFSPAGPVRYLTSAEWNLAHPGRHVLHDVTLGPGRAIMIGMPLQIRYCADRRNYAGQDVFMVTVRFLGFTHAVPIPWVDYGRPVVTNAPGGQPGHRGAFCP
ncbi:MAG: hypothetical protein ACRDND_33885 [Streptosporangiaceae bacterium]